MTFEMEMPDEFGGESNFLKEPGTYHCAITQVLEGQGPKGGIVDGFTVGLDVLAGTTEGQVHKVLNLTLWNPRIDQSEGGKKWARLKQGAFVIAASLVQPKQLGQRVQIDLQAAVGQQIVVKLVKEEGKEYLDLSYADIWHVDDPRCKDVPKHASAIAMIPSQFRHEAAWFDQLKPGGGAKSAGGNGGGPSSQRQHQQQSAQPTQPARQTVSYDDL